ncbi:MAG: nuclear transport factor 2 family protein [bacterium]|nr:nuclear transport factor 2 family protein [bacterium]
MDPSEKVVALVTQTQAVLEAQRSPFEALNALFAGKSPAEQQSLLESLERAGAGVYRRLAEVAPDPEVRRALLESAAREEANAETLVRLRGPVVTGAVPHAARTPAEFVDAFARFWAAPSPAGLDALLRPDVVLTQPLSPPVHGRPAAEAWFRTLLGWIPDVHAEIDAWGGTADALFIAFRLIGTLGGRPIVWPAVDHLVLDDAGMARSRASYFDPLPLLAATAARPRGWPALVRSGVLATIAGRGTR